MNSIARAARSESLPIDQSARSGHADASAAAWLSSERSTAATAYSVESTEIGALLDNPATKAVLVKHAPDLVRNDSFAAWRELTIRTVQKLVGQTLSDAQIDAIQADFGELAKK